MAELTREQRGRIKKMVQTSDGWDDLTLALDEYIAEVNAHRPEGANEFETLRDLHRSQGKVDGLKEFFEKLERLDI